MSLVFQTRLGTRPPTNVRSRQIGVNIQICRPDPLAPQTTRGTRPLTYIRSQHIDVNIQISKPDPLALSKPDPLALSHRPRPRGALQE